MVESSSRDKLRHQQTKIDDTNNKQENTRFRMCVYVSERLPLAWATERSNRMLQQREGWCSKRRLIYDGNFSLFLS